MTYKKETKTNFFLLKLFGRYAWPLRKLSFNKQKGIVAYLGTDINPPSRADIIIIPKTNMLIPHYHFERTTNRVICYSASKSLPFRDKSIDYFILSNALDFSLNPRQLLDEIVRVAKSGYIESPNVLLERFYPHPIRASELAISGDKLFISIKTKPIQDKFLSGLQLYKVDKMWKALFSSIPNLFFIRLNWTSSINYKIFGEKSTPHNSKAMWPKGFPYLHQNFRSKKNLKSYLLFLLEKIATFERKKRMNKKKFKNMFQCPSCKTILMTPDEYFRCTKCANNITKN